MRNIEINYDMEDKLKPVFRIQSLLSFSKSIAAFLNLLHE